MQANEYDLVVIGSGPAGQKGAICAAKMRKKVAIIDRRLTMGGVCVHTGTIPSKVLREAVLYLSGLRQRSFYGRGYVVKDRIMMSDLVLRSTAVMTREVEVIKAQLRRNHVTALEGDAHFADPHTIEIVNEDGVQQVRGDNILIACGTRPAHIDGIPVDGKRIFDSDQVHCLEEIPRELIVVGAGIIGLEYASMFAALGVENQLLDQRPRCWILWTGKSSRACAFSCGNWERFSASAKKWFPSVSTKSGTRFLLLWRAARKFADRRCCIRLAGVPTATNYTSRPRD